MQTHDSYLNQFIKKYCEDDIFHTVKQYVSDNFNAMEFAYNSDCIDCPEYAELIEVDLKFAFDVKVIGYIVRFKAIFESRASGRV